MLSRLVDRQLTLDKKQLLDGLFDESGAVRAIEVVGDPVPGDQIVRVYSMHGLKRYIALLLMQAYVCVCVCAYPDELRALYMKIISRLCTMDVSLAR